MFKASWQVLATHMTSVFRQVTQQFSKIVLFFFLEHHNQKEDVILLHIGHIAPRLGTPRMA